jgi:hypothetical protein
MKKLVLCIFLAIGAFCAFAESTEEKVIKEQISYLKVVHDGVATWFNQFNWQTASDVVVPHIQALCLDEAKSRTVKLVALRLREAREEIECLASAAGNEYFSVCDGELAPGYTCAQITACFAEKADAACIAGLSGNEHYAQCVIDLGGEGNFNCGQLQGCISGYEE